MPERSVSEFVPSEIVAFGFNTLVIVLIEFRDTLKLLRSKTALSMCKFKIPKEPLPAGLTVPPRIPSTLMLGVVELSTKVPAPVLVMLNEEPWEIEPLTVSVAPLPTEIKPAVFPKARSTALVGVPIDAVLVARMLPLAMESTCVEPVLPTLPPDRKSELILKGVLKTVVPEMRLMLLPELNALV